MRGQGTRMSLALLKSMTGRVVSFVLPERCPTCGASVEGGGLGQAISLCAHCLSRVERVYAPVCENCGWPVSNEHGLCVRCPGYKHVDRQRFAMVYGDKSTDMILRLKHSDRPEMARRLAVWMAHAGSDILSDADVLIPVPVHWGRLFQRQYNQSAEIARYLSRQVGLPMNVRSLRRVRATPPQGKKSKQDRRRNVSNAFSVYQPQDFVEKNIVLVDDVVTTGATVEACAKCLKTAGAKRVDVLTAAAVLIT